MSVVSSSERIGTPEDVEATKRPFATAEALEYRAIADKTWKLLDNETNKVVSLGGILFGLTTVVPLVYHMARENHLKNKAIRFDQLSKEVLPQD